MRDPTICPRLFALKPPKLRLKHRMRRLKVRIGSTKGNDNRVVSFGEEHENQWSDLSDEMIGVAEWLLSNGPQNTAQFAAQVTTMMHCHFAYNAPYLLLMESYWHAPWTAADMFGLAERRLHIGGMVG